MRSSPPTFPDVAAAILVGGASSRMGRDKVLLASGGVLLLERMYGMMVPLFRETVLVGHHRPEFEGLGAVTVEDILPDSGPLGGIYTALRTLSAPFVFVAAADMPFISPWLIRRITGARGGMDAVIPRGPRGLEPLCAVYSRSCAGAIRSSLDGGNRKIMDATKTLMVLTPEIRTRRGDPDMFFNLNRPEDLTSLREGPHRKFSLS